MSLDLPSSDAAAVDVSVVVPVRNEAGNVAPVIAEIAAALDGRWAYEIIYVNDGSTDATPPPLAEIMKTRKNLRRIDHTTSSGQSAAVRREGYHIGYLYVIDRPRHSGVSNYGFFDRLWIGIMDLAGVWWLIRRKKSTPAATEVTSHD